MNGLRPTKREFCPAPGRLSKLSLAVALLVTSGSLEGCATDGAAPAIQSTGPAVSNATDGPAKAFYDAEQTARVSNRPDDVKVMYKMGYSLIYVNCNEYFDSAGTTQTLLVTARDAVAAIDAVSTSILVLAKTSKTAFAAVGIGAGAAYAGIDLYTKDYLFSAENVDAVRTLTINALDTHHTAVSASLAATPSSATYDNAFIQLRDEQTICTLRHIAALATDAIKNGHLVATQNSISNDLAGIAKIQDEAVLAGLGTILQTPGPLTTDEAGALWEILIDRTTDTQRLKTLERQLSNLPSASSPFDPANPGTGTLRATWQPSASVIRTLQGFSDATKTGFEQAVLQSKDQQKKAEIKAAQLVAGGPAPPVPVPPISFSLAQSRATATGRIDVRAQ